MKHSIKLSVFILVLVIMSNLIYAHCQVPCGIYDDQTRFVMLREHITTIEKSMTELTELSKNPSANINQLVRWVNNKDYHADEFTEIVTYYFLAQRIKIKEPKDKNDFTTYQNQLTLLHQMMVYSMKCKQTTDLENVAKLRSLVDEFEKSYFTEDDLKHLKVKHKD